MYLLLIQKKGPNDQTFIESISDLIGHKGEPVFRLQPRNASSVPTKYTPLNLERAMKPNQYEIAAQ